MSGRHAWTFMYQTFYARNAFVLLVGLAGLLDEGRLFCRLGIFWCGSSAAAAPFLCPKLLCVVAVGLRGATTAARRALTPLEARGPDGALPLDFTAFAFGS